MSGISNPADLTELTAAVAANNALLVIIDQNVDDIEAVTNALPTLAETGGTVTTDGTEQNVYVNAAPVGIYNPIIVKINCTNHTATETIVIRTYYDIQLGFAGAIQEDEQTFVGLITPPLITIDLDPNRNGVWVTIEKTAGTNRDYIWQAVYEI